MQADSAEGKDNQCLISEALQKRFKAHQLSLKKVVADAGYSSGENDQYLENQHITPYIPLHGQFAVEREGFSYEEKQDAFICCQGKHCPWAGTLLTGSITPTGLPAETAITAPSAKHV